MLLFDDEADRNEGILDEIIIIIITDFGLMKKCCYLTKNKNNTLQDGNIMVRFIHDIDSTNNDKVLNNGANYIKGACCDHEQNDNDILFIFNGLDGEGIIVINDHFNMKNILNEEEFIESGKENTLND